MEEDTAHGSATSDDPAMPPDGESTASSATTADASDRAHLPPFDEQTTTPERSRASAGTVYLVGAGPGDPDLLTVRARRLVETADVVLHDALTRKTLVERLPSSAEVVDVGKRAEYKTPQSEINRLLTNHATAGDAVVRLKGGDPFVFGRGGEEAQHLAEHGVPFEIVPGVSSVIAAPALSGVPLTHRDISSRFTVITGHETPDKEESSIDWSALAREVETGGTLVVLMGVRTLDRNVSALRAHGVDADVPIALVQKAAWEDQRVVSGTLGTIVDELTASPVSPPATAIIGDVVAVRDEVADELEEFEPA